MKRTSLAVLMIALAIVALAAPLAFAQAPATKDAKKEAPKA